MPFTGQILDIPLGDDGLTGNKNQAQIRAGQLIQATNVSYERGTLSKEGGAKKYNTTAITGTPVILGGWDWWPSDGVQRMIVATKAGTLLKDTGAGTFGTTLKSGLTTDDVVYVFVDGGKEVAANNRKLFIFNNKNVVQVLSADGATTANLATPPADWALGNQPSVGVIHEGRLWGAGNLNDPHRVYYSLATNHEDFTTAGAGSISVYPGEGERIVGLMSYKGLLVVWKFPAGIYLVDTSAIDTANWRVTRLNGLLGGASPLGQVMVDDDVIFIDPAGNLHALSSVTEFGNLGSRNLSQVATMGPFIRDRVNLAKSARVRAAYYVDKREIHIGLVGAGSSINNRRLVMDFTRPGLPRFRWSTFTVQEALWLRKDANNIPRLMAGDNAGFVWHLDQAVKDKDGSGYPSTAQTPYLDFGHIDPSFSAKRKNGQFLELYFEQIGTGDVLVEGSWDGKKAQTLRFGQISGGAKLNSWTLGVHTLGSAQLVSQRRRFTGGGRRLSLTIKQSGAGEDFSVARALLYAMVGDERL